MKHSYSSVTIFSRRLGSPFECYPQLEIFFSTDHCQRLRSSEKLEDGWTPGTYLFPEFVTPREGLETGFVDSVDKHMFVHCDQYVLVPNPDPKYEIKELYDRYPMLHNNRRPFGISLPRPNLQTEYLGRSILSEVQLQIIRLWEPEGSPTHEESKATFERILRVGKR